MQPEMDKAPDFGSPNGPGPAPAGTAYVDASAPPVVLPKSPKLLTRIWESHRREVLDRRLRRRTLRRERKDWRRSRPGLAPRTFHGMAMFLSALGVIGAALGVSVVMFFTNRLDAIEDEFTNRVDAVTILAETEKLGDLSPNARGAGVVPVQSTTPLGNPINGFGVVVAAEGGDTFVLVPLSLVERATWDGTAPVSVLDGTVERAAKIWSWDRSSGLALVLAHVPGAQPLRWFDPETVPRGNTPVALSDGSRAVLQQFGDSTFALTEPYTGPEGTVVVDGSGGILGMVLDPEAGTGAVIYDACGTLVECATKYPAPAKSASSGINLDLDLEDGEVTEEQKQRGN